jgi:hypothetical protein
MIELAAVLTLLGADTQGYDYWTKNTVQFETRAECVENANALVSRFVIEGFTFNVADTIKTGKVTLEKGEAVLDVTCREVPGNDI